MSYLPSVRHHVSLCICYFVQVNTHLTERLQRDEETCLRSQTQKSVFRTGSQISPNPKDTHAFSSKTHCSQKHLSTGSCMPETFLCYFINLYYLHQFLINNFFTDGKSKSAERSNVSSKITSLLKSRPELDTNLFDFKDFSFYTVLNTLLNLLMWEVRFTSSFILINSEAR